MSNHHHGQNDDRLICGGEDPVELTPELFEKSRRGQAEAKRLRAQASKQEGRWGTQSGRR